MVPLNKILQNAPITPKEKILNSSQEIEEDMQKWAQKYLRMTTRNEEHDIKDSF